VRVSGGGGRRASRQALREANLKYEAKRRDLEDKFGAALVSLREQYLAEVLEIHAEPTA